MSTPQDFDEKAAPPPGRLPFSAAGAGRAQVLCTHCADCGYNNFPPSRVCASCMSLNVAALPLSSSGVLYSYTTMRSGDDMVFVGYVDLPEKIRLFAELEGFAAGRPPACDTPVSLSAIRHGADDPRKPGPVFVFAPTRQAGAAA